MSKTWMQYRSNRITKGEQLVTPTYGRGAHRVGRDAARGVADSMEHRTDERAVALLKGLDRRLGAETTMPVQIAEAALACVACGFGSRTRRTARC